MEIKNCISFHQAKEIDEKTILKGVPETILMGLAAQSVVISLIHLDLVDHDYEYIFVCGRGNNGGDGLAIAYLLKGFNYDLNIKIFLQNTPKSESSLFYYHQLLKNQIQIQKLEDFINEDFSNNQRKIIIEALLGSGQKDKPAGIFSEVLQKVKVLKNSNSILISIDLPAGLSEIYENFEISLFEKFFDLSIPDYIFNFGYPKLATALHPLLNAKSKIFNLPCGFDPEVEKEVIENHLQVQILEEDLDFSFFKKKLNDHKYTAGYSWIFAGSKEMEGAAILSSQAFFASGGGILHLIYPDVSSKNSLLHFDPGIILHNFDSFFSEFENYKIPHTIGIGPGLSRSDIEKYKNYFIRLFNYLKNFKKKFIILDAYATTLILDKQYPEELKPFTLITPHVGEWQQMGGIYPYLSSNIDKLYHFATTTRASVLIKGSISLFIPSIEKENRKIYIWQKQNSNLAIAGSGDVLTGIFCASFCKISFIELKDLIQKSLSLQYHTTSFHSKASDQILYIRNLLKNS